MFLSAVVVLFALLLAAYFSLAFNFYLVPTLLLFSWAFLVFAFSGFVKFPKLLILLLAILCFLPVYNISSRWGKNIDAEKRTLATAYIDLVSKALKNYYAENKSFPLNESFKETMWIISELELASFKEVKYRGAKGKLKVMRLKKPLLKDPWGARYIYEGEKDRAYLISSGPDLLVNTKDDIVKKIKPN